MGHLNGVWGALHDALNLSGIGALIAAIALHSKGKTDQRMLMAQLAQKTAADERDDGRDDRKAALDERNAASARMKEILEATERQRDFALTELEKTRSEIAEKRLRDEALAARGVTFEEAFVLVDEAQAARKAAQIDKYRAENGPPGNTRKENP